jgi:D-galactarolactone cycloisomerase
LPAGMEFAVDALWHLPPAEAVAMAKMLDERDARWLECPLDPEDVDGHARLAAAVTTPLAVGESYRTVRELQPIFNIATILQPDLGRCGITGTLAIAAAFGGPIIPHVSIAMGPQLAAAVHVAAALDHCPLCEFNPNVLATANAFMAKPLTLEAAAYQVPASPGLGIDFNERFAAVTAAEKMV